MNTYYKHIWFSAVLYLLVSITGGSIAASDLDHDSIRVSVIDSGASFKAKSALLDLLELELSKADNLELLERARLGSIVKEWELSNRGASRHSADWVVQAGKITSVDFFIFLHYNDSKNDVFTISWVDTRYGVVINRQELVKPSSGAVPDLADMLTEETVGQFDALPDDLKDAALIYFGSQKRIGPKLEQDDSDDVDFGGRLRSLIEYQINRAPGVYLAERLQAPLLTGEQDWNADIPNQLRGAAAVINFEYERSREDLENVVVSVMIQRGTSSRSSFTVTGLPTEPFSLAKEILAQSMQLMDIEELPLMTPGHEAKVLRALAKASKNPDTALDYNLASYALTPDDTKGLLKFLKYKKGVFPSPHKPSHQLTREEKLARDYVDIYSQYANEVLSSMPEYLKAGGYHAENILCHEFMETRLTYGNEEARIELGRRILPLIDKLVKQCKLHIREPIELTDLGSVIGKHIKNSMMFDPVYDGAKIENITKYLIECVRLEFFRYDRRGGPNLAVELASMGAEHKSLYMALSKHEEPQLQFIGYYGLVHIFTSGENRDFDSAKRYYREFIDFIFDVLLPTHPDFHDPSQITKFLPDRSNRRGGNRFHQNLEKDKRFRAEMAKVIYSRSLEFDPNIFLKFDARDTISNDLRGVADAGKPVAAYTLCQQYIDRIQIRVKELKERTLNKSDTFNIQFLVKHKPDYSVWIRSLKNNTEYLRHCQNLIESQHPGTRKLADADSKPVPETKEATPLLSLQDISRFLEQHNEKAHLSLHRILSWNDQWVLVTNRGLILIDPATKKPTSFLRFPDSETADQLNHANFDLDHRGMYINSSNGVLCVYWDGSSKLISNKNRLLKNGGAVAVMKDYLLTVYSEPISSRESKNLLVLHDLKTSKERVLFSDRSTMRDQPSLTAYSDAQNSLRSKLYADRSRNRFIFYTQLSPFRAIGYYPDEDRYVEADIPKSFINKGDRIVFYTSSYGRNNIQNHVRICDRDLEKTHLEFRSTLNYWEFCFFTHCYGEMKGRLIAAKGFQLFLFETDFTEHQRIEEVLFPWPDVIANTYGGILSDSAGPVILISGHGRRAGLYQADKFMKSLPQELLPPASIPVPGPGVAPRLSEPQNADAWLDTQLSCELTSKAPGSLRFSNFFNRVKHHEDNRASFGKWRTSRAVVTDVMGSFALSEEGRKRLYDAYGQWAEQNDTDSALCKAVMALKHHNELDPDGEQARETFTELTNVLLEEARYRELGKVIIRMSSASQHFSEQERLEILVSPLKTVADNLTKKKILSILLYRLLDEWDYTVDVAGSYLLECAGNLVDPDIHIIHSFSSHDYHWSGPTVIINDHTIKLQDTPSGLLEARRQCLDNLKDVYQKKYNMFPDHRFKLPEPSALEAATP